MTKKQTYLNEIDRYFKVLHDTGSLSSTEIENLIHSYLEYIFVLNNLNLEDLDLTINFVKNVSNVKTNDMQNEKSKFIASQMNGKEKTYSHKEVIRRNKHDNLNALMEYTFSNNCKYSIYLREKLKHIKSVEDFNSLLELLVDFGHETQHVIQHIKASGITENVYNLNARATNRLYNALKNGTEKQKKLVKRIYEKYSTFLDYLTTDEIYAEKNAYKYLRTLLQDLMENTNDDRMQNFYDLLDIEASTCEEANENFSMQTTKQFEEFKNTLPDNPFIKKEDLVLF